MSNILERTVQRSAEQLANRLFGKYRGVVTDITDPQKRCRIRATVPAVLDGQVSYWAEPVLPFAGNGHGFVMLPVVGDGVWIEFEGGNINNPLWSGCMFQEGRPDPASERVRTIVTSSGQEFVLDEGKNEIRLKQPRGGELILGTTETVLKHGQCELKMSASEISINRGMVKITLAGASLVNDAMKLGG